MTRSLDMQRLVMERAAPLLTEAELLDLTEHVSLAADAAARAAVVAEGIASLVRCDDTNTGASTGEFQDSGSVPDVLMHLSFACRYVHSLSVTGDVAMRELRRRQARPKK